MTIKVTTEKRIPIGNVKITCNWRKTWDKDVNTQEGLDFYVHVYVKCFQLNGQLGLLHRVIDLLVGSHGGVFVQNSVWI